MSRLTAGRSIRRKVAINAVCINKQQQVHDDTPAGNTARTAIFPEISRLAQQVIVIAKCR